MVDGKTTGRSSVSIEVMVQDVQVKSSCSHRPRKQESVQTPVYAGCDMTTRAPAFAVDANEPALRLICGSARRVRLLAHHQRVPHFHPPTMSGFDADRVYSVRTQNTREPEGPPLQYPSQTEKLLLDFLLQYRVGNEFIYRSVPVATCSFNTSLMGATTGTNCARTCCSSNIRSRLTSDMLDYTTTSWHTRFRRSRERFCHWCVHSHMIAV